MKFTESIELSQATSHKDLKGKHLSSGNFFDLLALKKKLKDHFEIIIEAEKELAKEYGAIEVGNQWTIQDSTGKKDEKAHLEFDKKLNEIHKEFNPDEYNVKLNFIAQDEFKKWTDEVELAFAAILFEHLAKKE